MTTIRSCALRGLRCGLVAGVALLGIASLALAGETSLTISSAPGDFIGLGRDYALTSADGVFTAYASPSYVFVTYNAHVGFDSWSLLFAAPAGGTLALAPYFDASTPPVQDGGVPTLSVSGNSHGCPSRGAFLIKRLEFGPGGTLETFWVTFEQACDGSAAGLSGELRLNLEHEVALAVPIDVRVEKGLPVTFDVEGTGRADGPVTLGAADLPPGAQFIDGGNGSGAFSWQTPFDGIGEHVVRFTARSDSGEDQATTRIAVTGISSIFLDGLEVTPRTPSSQILLTPTEGHIWTMAHDGFVTVRFDPPFPASSTEVSMGAPDGAPLIPGLYVGATLGWEPGHPLLSWACAGGRAGFEVIESRFTPGGRLLALHATFESWCPDRTLPYRGEVRYMADIPFLLRAPARVVAVEEQETSFPVRAFDVSGNVSAIAAGPLPEGANFVDHGDSTGSFYWTPAHGQAGLHAVTFTASGGGRQDVVPAVFDVRLRNDGFDDALPIPALPFQDEFDAAPATAAQDDPLCRSPDVTGTVWYSLTMPADATVELSTFGSRGTVRLGVYEGVRGALTELACDFDRITLGARAGATYHILVRPQGRMEVHFEASLPPPPPVNDDFDHATAIDTLPFAAAVRTDAATRAPDDPACAASGKTVWYTWTARDDLWVKVDPSRSEFPTSASVWTGSRGALSPVVCSGSSAAFRASPGTTYHVMLGAVEDVVGGHVVLAITATPAYRIDLAFDRSGRVLPRLGRATLSGTVTCSAAGFVHVAGSVGVRGGALKAAPTFDSWVECTGSTRFAATVGDEAAPLRAGWVEVEAGASGYEPLSGQRASDGARTKVLLTGGRIADAVALQSPGLSSIAGTQRRAE